MQSPKVVVFGMLPEDLLQRIASTCQVVIADPRLPDQAERFYEELKTAHGLIGAGVKLGAAELAQATELKVISSVSVGIDNYDQDYLRERGIALHNTPDVLTETTADTIFALLLASSRRLVELANFVRDGKWKKSVGPELYGTDVHGKTLAIVGFGRIGQAVARRAALGFGMPVVYVNRSKVDVPMLAQSARQASLDEALSVADFVALTLPLTPETQGLMGAAQFQRMKAGAIFVNGGRGQLVQEDALLAALDSGHLRAAGLDVFATEPLPLSSPLRNHPKVTALPHIGSATHETRRAMAEMATNQLLQALGQA